MSGRILAAAIALALCAASAVAQQASPVVTVGGVSVPPSVTVAQLPACSAATSGWVYRVTDSLLPALGVAVAGGGAVSVLVRCNATAWLVGQ